MSYLRGTGCCICLARLDKVKKENIRNLNGDNWICFARFRNKCRIDKGDKIFGSCISIYNITWQNRKKLI